jgi:hypothetical protein
VAPAEQELSEYARFHDALTVARGPALNRRRSLA